MTLDYKGYIIRVCGIGEFTMDIIYDGYFIITRKLMYSDGIHGGKARGEHIKSIDQGVELGKIIIDRYADELKTVKRKNKYKPREVANG